MLRVLPLSIDCLPFLDCIFLANLVANAQFMPARRPIRMADKLPFMCRLAVHDNQLRQSNCRPVALLDSSFAINDHKFLTWENSVFVVKLVQVSTTSGFLIHDQGHSPRKYTDLRREQINTVLYRDPGPGIERQAPGPRL